MSRSSLSRRSVALAFIPIVLGYAIVGLVMLDMAARKRVEKTTGVNAWGYQGLAMFHKAPDERRIALLGGSAAFGLGMTFERTPVFVFARFLNQAWRPGYRPGQRMSLVGLAEAGAGAGSYRATLDEYAYLTPDVICLYDGYAAVNGEALGGGRRASPVFRRTGYLPALTGPGAEPLPATVAIDPQLRDDASGDVSCAGRSATYCASMADAVDWGLGHGKRVVVVTPPYVSRRHQLQQSSLAALLIARFGADARFTYDNEGPSIDLRDRGRSFDGVHLTAAGIEVMADNLAAVLRAAAEHP